ncbi:peptide ABC transporter substrate-binding protein [Anaerobacillus sp. CMMVII]|uniref:peptide ABC transporter substrate-binding protein n=1 Tax=Anaerobacillus sp. CMMVII TaxID=2755588 RepID=UPI0021B7AAC1|nr:peptide ABC transporter substrate-binding protein [Anaerobacillus sp. CMMVII]MCT8138008.1 peptide ABC transporter substrate-binding protein [Anaerobacillus sp. CMMVII]
MKTKRLLLFSLLLALVLLFTGCFSQEKETTDKPEPGNTTTDPKDSTDGKKDDEKAEKKVLKLNNVSNPGSLHPQLAQGTHESWVLEHSFEGLTKKTPEGKIVAGMAEDWDVSEDGLTWTFTLKDHVKWSNGEAVTAGDFEYAWKFGLDPANASYYSYQLYYLAGGEEFNTAEDGADMDALRDAVGVKALDEKTLEVKLAKPTPYFLDLTSFYTYYPINQANAEAHPDWALNGDNYVSNGPFVLAEWKQKESMKIVKNENYYDKDSIKLDEVQFVMIDDENTAWQMYRTGELDLVYPLPQDVTGQLNASNDSEFRIGPDLAVYYYNLNTTVKPLNNAKVRQALAMTIDREAIVEHVSQGGQTPAYGVVPAGIPDVSGDFNENGGKLFEENAEKAKALLAEGLAEEGLTSFPNMVLTYNTSEGHKAIAEAIQEMWRKNLEVNITLENVEFQVKLDREKAGDFQISRAGWIGDYVDPMTFIDLWHSKSPFNDARFNNSEYDKLVELAQSTMDQSVRMKAMHDAHEILMEEMPVIPIYFYTKPYTLKPYVTGVFDPINSYPQFMYADITK